MTTIFLARHGATVLSKENRFAGSTDIELSDEGIHQAKKLSDRLAKEKIAAVYCSDMRRAVHTARIVAEPHHLAPIADPSLREIDHGHWEGLVHKDVEREFAAEYLAWEANPFLIAPPGGETGLSVLSRSLPALTRIVESHPGEKIAIISHTATNRLLLCSILGIDPRLYRSRIAQNTACLNTIEFRDINSGRIMLLNDISHYE